MLSVQHSPSLANCYTILAWQLQDCQWRCTWPPIGNTIACSIIGLYKYRLGLITCAELGVSCNALSAYVTWEFPPFFTVTLHRPDGLPSGLCKETVKESTTLRWSTHPGSKYRCLETGCDTYMMYVLTSRNFIESQRSQWHIVWRSNVACISTQLRSSLQHWVHQWLIVSRVKLHISYNSLWPCDAIWHHSSGSILAQIRSWGVHTSPQGMQSHKKCSRYISIWVWKLLVQNWSKQPRVFQYLTSILFDIGFQSILKTNHYTPAQRSCWGVY